MFTCSQHCQEPDFVPHRFEHIAKTEDGSLLSPGYIFLGLMNKPDEWGPRIYDIDGNLIWYGLSSVGKTRITDFHPCDYLGSAHSHLCWHDQTPDPDGGPSLLKKIFIDNTYSLVHNYTTRGNQHEFHMVDDATRFVTMDYKPQQRDLRPYCGAEDGWIWDPCIVEYGARTGEETWNWCFTDHLPIWSSTVYFDADEACQKNDTTPKAGKGTEDWPWDVGHLNAVDKDANGDYITSYRHLNEIMKIAGPTNKQHDSGSIIWRLGGRGNQFDKNFTFSRQHMVRFVNDTDERDITTIALFDNAWEGILEPSAKASSGQVIRLDEKSMKAELLHRYPHPHDELAQSRGSMEVLPNGNGFIGWGTIPDVSEYAENGTLLYHARFAPEDSGQYSYRAFKSPWQAYPKWPLKLVAYSRSCGSSSPVFAYVSWNGATEVKQWRFSTAAASAGPWHMAGTFNKTGFETQARLENDIAPYVKAEALDTDEKVLGSATEATFVPTNADEHNCHEEGCGDGFDYYAATGAQCTRRSTLTSYLASAAILIATLVTIECTTFVVEGTIRILATTERATDVPLGVYEAVAVK